MKKKVITLMLALTLTLSMLGCGSAADTNAETSEISTQESQSTTSEAASEETDTTAATDLEGYETFNNVNFILSDDWEFFQDTNGTKVYRFPDATESFAIYVQNETAYSADDMIAAYESSISATYGDNCTTETKTIGSLDWNVYHFTGDNNLNPAVAVDVYLYTDGATTIYLENCFAADSSASGKIQELLESVIIQ